MPDWILHDCPSCGNTLRFPAHRRAEAVRCPLCKTMVHLDEGGAAEPVPGATGKPSGPKVTSTPGTVPRRPARMGDETPLDSGKLRRIGWQPTGEDASAPTPPAREPVENPSPATPVTPTMAEVAETVVETGGEDKPEGDGDAKAGKVKHRRRKFGLTGEVLEWDAGAPRARGRDHGGSRVLAAGAAVLAAVALVAGILLFSSKGRTADGGGVATATESAAKPVMKPAPLPPVDPTDLRQMLLRKPTELLAKVKPSIEAFLRAPDTNARLAFVRQPSRVQPLMQAYYKIHPAGPMAFASIAPDGQLAYRDNLLVLKVLMKDYQEKQMAVEYTGDKFLIDWESFVGFSEMEPAALRDKRPSRAVTVRVAAAYANPPYYNYAFTDEENLICYLITFPDDTYLFAYTEKFSVAASRMRELLGSGAAAMAVLKIKYPESAPVGEQVWIEEVLAEGWVLGEMVGVKNPEP